MSIQTMIQSTMATDGPLPDLNASWMDHDMYSRHHITFALTSGDQSGRSIQSSSIYKVVSYEYCYCC